MGTNTKIEHALQLARELVANLEAGIWSPTEVETIGEGLVDLGQTRDGEAK